MSFQAVRQFSPNNSLCLFLLTVSDLLTKKMSKCPCLYVDPFLYMGSQQLLLSVTKADWIRKLNLLSLLPVILLS